jgi:hypothetical protein
MKKLNLTSDCLNSLVVKDYYWMGERKSNTSNRTARRAAKSEIGRKAGKNTSASAARRVGKSAKKRTKDKRAMATNREILDWPEK